MAENIDYHIPVLLEESMEALNIKPGGVYVDLTFGGGGHSKAILKRLGDEGLLVSFDQDEDVLANIPDDERLFFIHSNFRFFRSQLRLHGIEQVDGILADLGVSSHHFDDSSRGFSFRFDTPLDMRMNREAGFSALNIVNEYSQPELTALFRDYGELQMPHKIASAVLFARETGSINTTSELMKAVERFVPRGDDSKFYAKLFQALRIEVNHEIEALKMMLEQSAKILAPGGRLAIITYHSLEDRPVKNFFKTGSFSAEQEKDIFGNTSSPLLPEKKVITPSAEELNRNTRSRSAKLRVATKK